MTYFGAYWGDPVTDQCRWSSETTNQLLELKDELALIIQQMIENKSSNISSILDILKEANLVLRFAREMTAQDVGYTASIAEMSVQSAIEGVYLLDRTIGREVVKLADKLLDVDNRVLQEAEDACLSIANTLQDYAGNVALSLLQADSVKHFTKNVYVEVYQTRWEISQLPVLKWFFHKDENSTSSDPVISISIPFTRNATPPEDQPGDSSADPIKSNNGFPFRTASVVYYSSKFFNVNQQVSLAEDNAVVYVHIYQNGEVVDSLQNPVSVTFYHPQSTWGAKDVACSAASITPDQNDSQMSDFRPVGITWSPLDCTLNVTNLNFTTCICRVLDLLAVVREVMPTPRTTTKAPPPDPMAFIGIPYSRALSITSYIGYAISILSLTFTLTTYSLFKKVRRGRPTLILVNLCVAVLLLVTVLLTAVSFCHTRNGCRIANILRVYFILVSMMWNGVEAVHMYLALVKVFTSYTSHFVLKAGIITWGIPMLYVLIPVAVNVGYFDGTVVDCSFACYLSDTAFYFVFLLPMVVIMIFNSVVFGMVLRVINRIYSNDGRRSKLSQLRGAVALMVLLGLTWSLGAASAANYRQYDNDDPPVTAIALQALFVICVAFQGFFICVFHCLRYRDVREQWWQLIKKVTKMLSPNCKPDKMVTSTAENASYVNNIPAICEEISVETYDTRL
ncbi:adhesion G-protein coupled receptor G4-like isoform X2 [Apostichopus japonicus]